MKVKEDEERRKQQEDASEVNDIIEQQRNATDREGERERGRENRFRHIQTLKKVKMFRLKFVRVTYPRWSSHYNEHVQWENVIHVNVYWLECCSKLTIYIHSLYHTRYPCNHWLPLNVICYTRHNWRCSFSLSTALSTHSHVLYRQSKLVDTVNASSSSASALPVTHL